MSWPILQHFSHTQLRRLDVQQNTHQICHKLLNMINIFGHKLLLRREKNQHILALKFENLHLLKEVDTLRHGHHCDRSAADSRGYWEPPDGLND